jgi:hypothetical protein
VCFYVSSETLTAQIKDDEGSIQYLSGITGLVNVAKIIDDGSAEAPGVGLPSEQPGVRYIIRTNTGIGSLNAGWGPITGLLPNDIIQRANNNSQWHIVRPASLGAGDVFAYDLSRKEIYTYNNTSWVSTQSIRTQLVVANDTLQYNKLHLVDNTGGPLTLVLPSAISHEGDSVTIKISVNSSNIVTINTTSGQTIDGSGSDSLSIGYSSAKYTAYAGNWLKI